jgi:integrase
MYAWGQQRHGRSRNGEQNSAASLAVSAGANVKVVQRMLGHKSAAMTLDVYADLFGDDLDDVARRLDERYWANDSRPVGVGQSADEIAVS